MSDTNTPSQPIETPPIIDTNCYEVGHESLYNAETNAMLEANFKESARKKHLEDQQAGEIDGIIREESKMVALERDDPEQFIAQLGAMATVRNKAEGAKFAQKVESRTYRQVADGVVSREEYQPQAVIPEKKPKLNLLDTNTRLGRAVSMIFFGENNATRPAYKFPKAQRTSKPIHEMTGGNLSQDYVNKINYPR